MSKFSSRINRLQAKTHRYFPHSDFQYLCAYQRARLEDNQATPEQYAKHYARIVEIGLSVKENPNEKLLEEMNELFDDDNTGLSVGYFLHAQIRDNYPRGIWVNTGYAASISRDLIEAENYFKHCKNRKKT